MRKDVIRFCWKMEGKYVGDWTERWPEDVAQSYTAVQTMLFYSELHNSWKVTQNHS